MLAAERQRAILRLLAERGRLTVGEFAARFGISPATARRDAHELTEAGLAQRTHGGLLAPDFFLHEPAFSRKAEEAVPAKVRLARAAALLAPETGTVFVDAGTTCLEVGRQLLGRPGLRIVTGSVPLLALAPEAAATLVALGGEVRPASLAMTGALAQSWMANLRFDAAILGASGLECDQGASTTELAEAGLKAEALRRARIRILVAHAEKWERPAGVRFAPWDAFNHFVTDRQLPPAGRLALNRAGVRIRFVSVKP